MSNTIVLLLIKTKLSCKKLFHVDDKVIPMSLHRWMYCFFVTLYVYSYGMENQTIVQFNNTSYQSFHTSVYLDQIFGPMSQKTGQTPFFEILLDYAKKKMYCPETTMIFLQFGATYVKNVGGCEPLCKIFDFLTNGMAFRPTHYNPDRHFFQTPNRIEFDDCIIDISNPSYRPFSCLLSVHLKKPAESAEKLLSHTIKMEKKIKELNNLAQKDLVILEYDFVQYHHYKFRLTLENDYLFFLPNQSWIHDLHYANSCGIILKHESIIRGDRDIKIRKKNGNTLNISLKDLVKKCLNIDDIDNFDTEDFHVKDFHIIDALEKQYIIFKVQYSQIKKSTTIKIFEINEELVNIVEKEPTKTINYTYIQTIFLPFKLMTKTLTKDGKVCLDFFPDKNIRFNYACISTPKGSLLMFNSIFSNKNYSLIPKQEAEKYLAILKKLKDKEKDLKDKETAKKLKEEAFILSPEYQNAIKEYTFSKKLQNYLSLVLDFNLVPLITYLAAYFVSILENKPCFFNGELFFNLPISLLLAIITIHNLENSFQTNLNKNFPGIQKIYYKKYITKSIN